MQKSNASVAQSTVSGAIRIDALAELDFRLVSVFNE